VAIGTYIAPRVTNELISYNIKIKFMQSIDVERLVKQVKDI